MSDEIAVLAMRSRMRGWNDTAIYAWTKICEHKGLNSNEAAYREHNREEWRRQLELERQTNVD